MDVAQLAELEHENLIVANRIGGSQVPGAVVERREGVAVTASGHPIRSFNQVLIVGPSATEAAVERAVARARSKSDDIIVNLRIGIDDRFTPLMATLGLVRLPDVDEMPGMAMTASAFEATPAPADLRVERTESASGVADHAAALARGFGLPERWIRSIVTERLLAEPAVSVYVGYVGAVPVVAGMGVMTDRTIGVYNIATVEAHRGRGYGAAMTSRVVDDGLTAGCEAATLQSSPMGRRIYERLGFRTVISYRGFIEAAKVQP